MGVLIVVLAILFLTFTGQVFFALLIGIAGAVALLMTAEGGRKGFEPVEVPPAGGYPGWDFWKSVLEDFGTFTGGVFKTATKIDKAIDIWGDFVKGKVWQSKSSSDEWIIPGLLEKVDKNKHLVDMVTAEVDKVERSLVEMYKHAKGSKEREKIMKALAKAEMARQKALKLGKEKKLSEDDIKKALEEIVKELQGNN